MDLDQGFAYVSFGIVLFVWEFFANIYCCVIFPSSETKIGRIGKITSKNY